jgi:hypothetical protein
MFIRTAQPGLWFIAGSFAQCRIYSKYLGLQIKACDAGLYREFAPLWTPLLAGPLIPTLKGIWHTYVVRPLRCRMSARPTIMKACWRPDLQSGGQKSERRKSRRRSRQDARESEPLVSAPDSDVPCRDSE